MTVSDPSNLGGPSETLNGKIIFQKDALEMCIFKNIFERYHACILREIASRDESEIRGQLFRIIELKGHFYRYTFGT
jgi:hypothetical protein